MKKYPNLKKLNIILVISFLFILIVTEYPEAQEDIENTIYVSHSGTSDFQTIQEAINAANESDTIYVYGGIYYENIVINKKINLVGEDKETTIIDGNNNGTVVFLSPSSNYVNISGFTIQNSGNEQYFTGIDVNSDYDSIYDNIITNCNYGISLEFWSHNCRIYANYIQQNTIGIFSSSIYPNNNLISRNNFIENSMNAYDNCNSTWFYSRGGNYWDDYTGIDNTGDGIGDTPYDIAGGNSQDLYPLIEPYQTPGFEMILLLFAFFIVFLIFRKKK